MALCDRTPNFLAEVGGRYAKERLRLFWKAGSVRYFHVTSSLNRESIRQYGLDWRRMGASAGIAGSRTPEQEGCFVCDSPEEATFFVHMGCNRGGRVDIWGFDWPDDYPLVESPEHFFFIPEPIPAGLLELFEKDVREKWGTSGR